MPHLRAKHWRNHIVYPLLGDVSFMPFNLFSQFSFYLFSNSFYCFSSGSFLFQFNYILLTFFSLCFGQTNSFFILFNLPFLSLFQDIPLEFLLLFSFPYHISDRLSQTFLPAPFLLFSFLS